MECISETDVEMIVPSPISQENKTGIKSLNILIIKQLVYTEIQFSLYSKAQKQLKLFDDMMPYIFLL